MSGACKIYTLHDPDTLAVRYVGFTTKTLEKRLARHVKLAKFPKSGNSHRISWIRSIIALGKRPVILLVETVSPENWQERERFWISHFRGIGCDLTNSCDGGDGVLNPTDEVRAKMGAKNRGRVHSAETRARMAASRIGIVVSKEARARMGAARRGKPISKEQIEKLRASRLGKSHSAEARAKIGLAHRGRIREASHCKKISEAKNRPVTEVSTGRIFPSRKSAAAALGVDHSRISKWIKSGRFKCNRVAAICQPKGVISE